MEGRHHEVRQDVDHPDERRQSVEGRPDDLEDPLHEVVPSEADRRHAADFLDVAVRPGVVLDAAARDEVESRGVVVNLDAVNLDAASLDVGSPGAESLDVELPGAVLPGAESPDVELLDAAIPDAERLGVDCLDEAARQDAARDHFDVEAVRRDAADCPGVVVEVLDAGDRDAASWDAAECLDVARLDAESRGVDFRDVEGRPGADFQGAEERLGVVHLGGAGHRGVHRCVEAVALAEMIFFV